MRKQFKYASILLTVALILAIFSLFSTPTLGTTNTNSDILNEEWLKQTTT